MRRADSLIQMVVETINKSNEISGAIGEASNPLRTLLDDTGHSSLPNGSTKSLEELKMTTRSPSEIHAALSAPFDPSEEKTREGPRGITLTYIDARAVMNRLDEVVGTENWSSTFHEVKGVVVCELTVTFVSADSETGEEYRFSVTKSDGAGESDIEGEKGQFSDAFKRAAVHFGIGRYLYSLGPKKRSTSVASAVLDGIPPAPDGLIDGAYAKIRDILNELDAGQIDISVAKDRRDDVLYSWTAEEKIQLWQRFDSASRRAIKAMKMDW